ncbi:MAG TPA: FUSC family protein [Kineosporiaceae bacterium]|nr:FUSC family protein [Kineosporiaceae bacterium]
MTREFDSGQGRRQALAGLARARLALGATRWRTAAWGAGQSALAGCLAWEAGVQVLHHPSPYFAAVAAIVCLGTTQVNRLRRVGELAVGVTVGVGIADLVVHQIGRGGWQIGLVVLLAMSVALLLDGGTVIVNQAALQAVFVTVLPPPVGGLVTRWEDALLGGAIALAVAFALPADPRPALRRECAAVILTTREALLLAVRAATAGDVDGATEALDLGRGTHPALVRWAGAITSAREVSRLSPLRRHAEAEIAAHEAAQPAVDRAVRNLRVALRRVVAAVEDAAAGEAPLPAPVLDILADLAGVLRTIPSGLRDPDGEGGRRAIQAVLALARRLDVDALQATSLSATVIVAQVRSVVVDLLHLPGMPDRGRRDVLPR